VLAIVGDNSEEFDENNNPVLNPANIDRGANHLAEGQIVESLTAREKIRLSVDEWRIIREAVEHGTPIPSNSSKDMLLHPVWTHGIGLGNKNSGIRTRIPAVQVAWKLSLEFGPNSLEYLPNSIQGLVVSDLVGSEIAWKRAYRLVLEQFVWPRVLVAREHHGGGR
jgi:hypothetical protein